MSAADYDTALRRALDFYCRSDRDVHAALDALLTERGRLKTSLADAETEKIRRGTAVIRLREAVEALVDVMPYCQVNPDAVHFVTWNQWRKAALDKAALALEYEVDV